jgi:NADH-quinone oxidoreductase subunit N
MTIASAYNFQASGTLMTIAALVGVIGAISATVGNTAAFVQTNIKRLLAYSSIAHAGYMLCAISLLIKTSTADPGFDPSSAAAQSVLLYLAVYLFMNLGAFTVAGLVFRQTGSELIVDYAGLGRRSPILAACMFAFLVSLIGLPPFAGFIAKLNVLWVLFQNGGWWWALIIVIGVNTIISAFYYFRVIRTMYLENSTAPAFHGHPLGMAISVACAIVLVVMLIGYGPLKDLTTNYSHLFMPTQAPAVQASAGLP